jgi:uncharacterized protein (TIGR00730 family)
MRVFISGGTLEGVLNSYKELASNVATICARKGLKLVFNGIDTALMGTTYMTYKYEGGKVKGFYDITNAGYQERLELDASDISPTTFDMANKLYKHANLIIILPGSFETLSSFFSMINEKIVKKDDKKIILFNYDNYYDKLLYQIKYMIDEKFLDPNLLNMFDIVTNMDEFNKLMNEIEGED